MEVRDEYVADTSRYGPALREAARDADKFGNSNDKAALAARKMGLAASEAANKAARAQKDAADAAEKLARGELSADEAAQAEAKALREVERAAIKAAEAERATARAAEDAADKQRKLARDAELAGAAQRLAAYKAAGAVGAHNSALRSLESRFGDLGKEGNGAFKEIEQSSTSTFKAIASSGPGTLALVVAALGAIPFAALGAESAISLGVGGALAGVGLAATKSDADVQAALGRMTSHIKSETKQMAAPFKDTWMAIAQEGTKTFDTLAPEISADFAELAPVITDFVHNAGHAVTQLAPAFAAATSASDKLLTALGGKLPEISRSLGSAIEIMSNSAGDNADAFANFASAAAGTLPPLAHLLDWTVKAAPAFNLLYGAMAGGGASISALHDGLSKVTFGLVKTDHSLKIGGGSFETFGQGAISAAAKAGQLLTAEQAAALGADQLKTALDALTGKTLTQREAMVEYRHAITEMSQALKENGRAHGFNSEKGAQNEKALDQVALSAQAAAEAMKAAGRDPGPFLEQARQRIVAMAEKMHYSASAAQDLASKLLGIKPVTLVANDADFVSKLHNAQGLKLDPKTGLLLGNDSDYFNKWLKSKGLTINPKTGLFRGNNADYYNKWLKANGLKISTKTGKITGNTSAFWAAVHSIPQTVGYRRIGVYYVPLNSANEPGKTRADGGIDRYADGGVRRDLPPMIVDRPTVLFGETETGGEAYIPLGQSKRERSTELLAQVADMFGLAVVKPLADGMIEKYAKGKVKKPTKAQLASAAATRSRALSRPEEIAALAAQRSLAAMRSSIYGGFARGGRPGIGSNGSTVVQHVTTINVNVAGSIRSDQDIAKIVQRQLLTNRMPVSLPAGR